MLHSVLDFLFMFRTNKTVHLVPFKDIYVSSVNKVVLSKEILSVTVEPPVNQLIRYTSPTLLWILIDFMFYERYISTNVSALLAFMVLWCISLFSVCRVMLSNQYVLLKVSPRGLCLDEHGHARHSLTLKHRLPRRGRLRDGFFKPKVVIGEEVFDLFPNKIDNELEGKPYVTGEALEELEGIRKLFNTLNGY